MANNNKRERVDLSVFGSPERSWPYEHCVVCCAEAQFGYRNAAGELQWFCSPHRLATYWADARRSLKCLQPPNDQDNAMDMRQYATKYIKPDQVRDGSITTRIVNVFEGERHGRPVLELETGSEFTLNDGNTNTLIKAWGYNSNDWIGQEVELFLGTYKDWKEEPPIDKETVKIRAISPAKTTTANGGESSRPVLPPSRAVASKKDDMDDAIPFVWVLFIAGAGAAAWLAAGGNSLIA
jgi:hypothetical protein